METARGLGELLKGGWRPKRTIILASWDGEEWGLLGSTEWVEKHAKELSTKAVAYINSDSTSKGWLDVVGLAFAAGVRQRPDARPPGSEARQARRCFRRSWIARSARRRPTTRRRRIDAAAATSRSTRSAPDPTTPRSSTYLTIASLNMGFGGEGRTAASITPPTTRSTGTRTSPTPTSPTARRCRGRSARRILRLADADILPFEFTATGDDAARLRRRDRQAARKRHKGAPPLELTPLLAAVERLAKAADNYDAALGAVIDARRGARSREAGRAEPAALHLGARLQVRRGPAEARVVQAPRLRAGVLHRLRRQDAARASAKGSNRSAWDEPRKYIPIVADGDRQAGRAGREGGGAGTVALKIPTFRVVRVLPRP